MKFTFTSVILISCALILGACAKRPAVKETPEPEISEPSEVTEEGEVDISGTEFVETPALKPITFDLDKYYLSAEARSILQKNAEQLKAHADWEVLIEGHCDERGTIEYNLALGQKRAREVREYYGRLGISLDSMGTISYGEEKPACNKSTESCWLANRRSETKVRLK